VLVTIFKVKVTNSGNKYSISTNTKSTNSINISSHNNKKLIVTLMLFFISYRYSKSKSYF